MAPTIAPPSPLSVAALEADKLPTPSNLDELSNEIATPPPPSLWKDAILARMPLLYVFFSGLGFSIQSLIVKLLRDWYGLDASFQCVFVRGVAQLSSSAVIIYLDEDRRAGNGPMLFGNTSFVRWMLFFRAFFGYFGIAFSFLAVEYIPIGDSTVLVMMSPVIAALAGFLILGEPWRLTELTATLLAITGGVLVAKPPFLFGSSYSDAASHADNNPSSGYYYFAGVLCSLVAAGGAGLAYVFVRILGTTAKMPWANVIFSQAIAQLVLTFPVAYLLHKPLVWWGLPPAVYALAVCGALVGCVSQIAMTVGMQREKSATASAMRTSDVVFGFVWQAVFTRDGVSALSVLGAALVAAGIVAIVAGKTSAPEEKAVGDGDGDGDGGGGVEMVAGGGKPDDDRVRYTRLATTEEV